MSRKGNSSQKVTASKDVASVSDGATEKEDHGGITKFTAPFQGPSLRVMLY